MSPYRNQPPGPGASPVPGSFGPPPPSLGYPPGYPVGSPGTTLASPPGAIPSPPLGTPRPDLPPLRPPAPTLQEIHEVAEELAASQGGAPSPEVSRGVQMRKLSRLEYYMYSNHIRVTDLETGMREVLRRVDAGTRVSVKGAWRSQLAAYASSAMPLLWVFSTALGDYGREHPGAPLTLTGVVLALAKAINLWRGPGGPGAQALTDPSPPPPPPPEYPPVPPPASS